MDEELLGYVASSGWRRRVLRSLGSHGEVEPERLASTEHLPRRVVERVLEDAAERGLVERSGGSYSLTSTGERLVAGLGEFEG